MTTRHFFLAAKIFALRCATVPFQSALSILAIWSGFAGILGATIGAQLFQHALRSPLADVFDVLYILAGVMMFGGVGWTYRNVEASGLILLATTLAVRLVAYSVQVGWNDFSSLLIVQSLVFVVASAIRLTTLLKSISEGNISCSVSKVALPLLLFVSTTALISSDTLSVLTILIGGGGIATGVVALFKIKPEVARVTVSAAEGAVLVQTGVIASLRAEIERLCLELANDRRIRDEERTEYKTEIEALHRAFATIDERRNSRRDDSNKFLGRGHDGNT